MSDITLPRELAETGLSLEEIGAIFVLFSLPNLSDDIRSYWSNDDSMVSAGVSLTERGIVEMSTDDNDETIMTIDVSKLEIEVGDFWQVFGYDDSENTIYVHDDLYGDEDGCFYFRLTQKLYEDEILWKLSNSDYSLDGNTVFDTKEDAQKEVENRIKQAYESIKLGGLNKQDGGKR